MHLWQFSLVPLYRFTDLCQHHFCFFCFPIWKRRLRLQRSLTVGPSCWQSDVQCWGRVAPCGNTSCMRNSAPSSAFGASLPKSPMVQAVIMDTGCSPSCGPGIFPITLCPDLHPWQRLSILMNRPNPYPPHQPPPPIPGAAAGSKSIRPSLEAGPVALLIRGTGLQNIHLLLSCEGKWNMTRVWIISHVV